MSEKVFRIDPGYQQYDWGKKGSASAVARYVANANSSFQVEEDKPYAELWMGTHPKVPSFKTGTKQSLRELISADAEGMLDKGVIEKFNSAQELPFLFKVLSIAKVLSIQAHPDKELGKKLHIEDPANYPDDNHKPEMAIAISDFEGFCGFKPLGEIADELRTLAEFRNVVSEDVADRFIKDVSVQKTPEDNKMLLRSVFERVMSCDEAIIEKNAKALLERARNSPSDFKNVALPELLIRLNEQFPNDIGLFCGGLMLNHCVLKSGEAMFLKAKDPHAYICGDIIECMAASDNVVRAGFTPKFKDVKNLVSMLTYTSEPVEQQKMQPNDFKRSSGDGKALLYDPPIEEFAVLATTFPGGKGTRKFEGLHGPSIMIVTEGSGYIKTGSVQQKADYGYVFFIAPGQGIELVADSTSFTTYRAFVEPN